SNIYSVTYKVRVQSFENGLPDKYLSCHSSRMSHTRTSYSLYQRLFDHTVLYIKRKLTSPLLRSTPPYSVSEPGYIAYLRGSDPLSLLRYRSRPVIAALFYTYHFLDLIGILHIYSPLILFFPFAKYHTIASRRTDSPSAQLVNTSLYK